MNIKDQIANIKITNQDANHLLPRSVRMLDARTPAQQLVSKASRHVVIRQPVEKLNESKREVVESLLEFLFEFLFVTLHFAF